MLSFALITEGITDQIVIERIMSVILERESGLEIELNRLQPLSDESDRGRQAVDEFGGFENLLDYCSNTEKMAEALEFNQYLVIQVDTDRCEHRSFGLALNKAGREVETEELISDVKRCLIEKITPDFYNKHQDRIIFGVSVHSTECWLLPFFSNRRVDQDRKLSCQEQLNRALNTANITYSKNGPGYDDLCKVLKKPNELRKTAELNVSLNHFIETLDSFQPFNVEL